MDRCWIIESDSRSIFGVYGLEKVSKLVLVPILVATNWGLFTAQQIRISSSTKSHQTTLEGLAALHKDSTSSEDHEMWNWPHFEDHSLSFES